MYELETGRTDWPSHESTAAVIVQQCSSCLVTGSIRRGGNNQNVLTPSLTARTYKHHFIVALCEYLVRMHYELKNIVHAALVYLSSQNQKLKNDE